MFGSMDWELREAEEETEEEKDAEEEEGAEEDEACARVWSQERVSGENAVWNRCEGKVRNGKEELRSKLM